MGITQVMSMWSSTAYSAGDGGWVLWGKIRVVIRREGEGDWWF